MRRSIPWLVIAGVLVAALSLRGPVVAPTPVLALIEADLGIGSAAAGLITTAPVLMFALMTPVAALVIRRTGAERALLLSLSGVLLGTLVRAIPGFGWMLVGMIVIGASITIGNVVIPVIIRRDVPTERVGLVTAAYVAMLNVGSLITSLLTAPLAALIGWQLAILAWSVITLGGLVLWGAHLRHARRKNPYGGQPHDGVAPVGGAAVRHAEDFDPEALTGPLPVVSRGRRGRSVLRHPVAGLLLGTFACQTAMYYGLSTWLPTLTADELGLDIAAAGALASLFQGAAILGAFVVPLLTRYTPRAVPALAIGASWIVLTVGMLVAPDLLALWVSIGAIGHAGGFVLIVTALVGVARDDAEAAGMSAFVQGGGYAVGALGGPLIGAVRDATGGWTVVLVMMLAIAVVYGILLIGALGAAARSRR